MSEEEINKRRVEQDARDQELAGREAEFSARAGRLADDERRLAEARVSLEEAMANRERELVEATQSLALREATARAGFVVQQREAFHEVVETRNRDLDARQAEVDAEEARMRRSLEKLTAVCQVREQALEQEEAATQQRARQLETQAAELRGRRDDVEKAERERDAGFVEARSTFEKGLHVRRLAIEAEAEAVRQRASVVATAEATRDAGFTEARRALDLELHGRRQQVEQAIASLHLEGVGTMERELSEESHRRRAALELELREERTRAAASLADGRVALEEERSLALAALAAEHEAANRRDAKLTTLGHQLDLRERSLDERDTAFEARRKALDSEVEQRVEHRQRSLDAAHTVLEDRARTFDEDVAEAVADRKASFDRREQTLQAELARLRGQLQGVDRMNALFAGLKGQLGGRDAELVLAEIDAQKCELQRLREDLAQAPPAMREEHDKLRAERDRLQSANVQLGGDLEATKARLRGEDVIRRDLLAEKDQTKWLTAQQEALQGRCGQLSEENKRLRASYERPEDREARIGDIVTKDLTEVARRPRNPELKELDWLDGIDKQCKEYGLHFHPRILKAFHTSLKTAEWSPLTVLAGVSGTGKSELPRLYAHFGGMTFKSLAVQPNWDSQESMLGYFNSIDNRFDAQPVLRLLARSQSPWEETNHGLLDSVVLILLDEMNLAHAELYFAEFLSKLELRRGSKSDVPKLEVKLGSGMLPYELPLGRNVLWTGTMNQDETTKSLSDKVLDRSIVIHFPRPAQLQRRRDLKTLPAPAPLLHRKDWESWWTKSSAFTEDEIAPFKEMIESVNEAMAKVGRALGHRVWQSVEYYMANYPDTMQAQRTKNAPELKAAMRVAFEDQLVQKIMPKLRGIETRGRSKTDCLDRIRTLLVEQEYNIIEDYDLSCECGYGQFIWQTSSFLQPHDVARARPSAGAADHVTGTGQATSPGKPDIAGSGATVSSDQPPSSFYPSDPSREEKWARLSPTKRAAWVHSEKEAR